MHSDQAEQGTSAYLRLVFKQVPGVVWATDRELRLTYVLGRTQTIDEEVSAELVGRTVPDFVGSRDPSEPAVAHHLAALAGGRQSFDYVLHDHIFAVLIEPLRDEAGEIVGTVGAALDVTDRLQSREQLARSEARLAEAQRMARIGSFEWDIATDTVTWSDELRRIYGFANGESGGTLDAFLRRLHPGDRARVRLALFDASRHPGPFNCEHRLVRPEGETRVLQIAGDVAVDKTGVPVRVVASCWDITAQRQTTERLEQSLSLLRATLDSTADGILVVDRDGRVAAYNQRFLTLWRVPPALAERGHDREMLTHVSDQLEDPRAFLDGVRELYTTPEREALDVLHFRDGRTFERFSMPRIVEGEPVGRVWSFRDVTRREQLLRRTTFLADATRLLSTLDVNKAVSGVAQLCVPYLGESCAIDLIHDGAPRRIMVAGDPGEKARVPELHPAALSGHSVIYSVGTKSHMVVPLMCRNAVIGAITFVAPRTRQYTNVDLELSDALARRISLSIDNARLYQAAHDALKVRDEFLSIAAHELRGPLTSLHLAVQGLLHGALPPAAARTALDVIQREDRRLARFVDDLLDLGRIRTGQLHFHLEEVDLGTVLRDVVSRHAAEAAQSGSKVTVTSEGDLAGQWDRSRLEQVVTNLLSNAIKYGEGQPIEISATESAGHVTLKVSDRGIGIPSDMLDRIFDPYQRAVDVRHYGGLGLGLHIVKVIVEALGGRIRVDSRPAEGATFSVDLPKSRSVV